MLGPVFFAAGSFAGDLWIVAMGLLLLLASFGRYGWQWTKQPWLIAAVAFWSVAILSALLSADIQDSVGRALAWLRFPLAAAAMVLLIQEEPKRFKRLVFVAFVTVLFLSISIIIDRALNPNVPKVFVFYGTPAEAAWISRGVGFFVACVALALFCQPGLSRIQHVAMGGFVLIWYLAFPIGGEVYITAALTLGFGLFLMAARLLSLKLILLASMLVGLLAVTLLLNEALFYRFTEQAMERLPWHETSDYYPAWIGGLRTALMQPLIGIGPEQFWTQCKELEASGRLAALGVERCAWHPHNTFIQLFAETGILGLAFYVVMLLAMGGAALKQLRTLPRDQKVLPAATLATVFLYLWPISTYSGAFGQHMNSLTWFSLGIALGALEVSRSLVTPSQLLIFSRSTRGRDL